MVESISRKSSRHAYNWIIYIPFLPTAQPRHEAYCQDDDDSCTNSEPNNGTILGGVPLGVLWTNFLVAVLPII